MALNQRELENLRFLIHSHETAYQKLAAYSQQAVDPQIKELFESSAQDVQNSIQKLMKLLN